MILLISELSCCRRGCGPPSAGFVQSALFGQVELAETKEEIVIVILFIFVVLFVAVKLEALGAEVVSLVVDPEEPEVLLQILYACTHLHSINEAIATLNFCFNYLAYDRN